MKLKIVTAALMVTALAACATGANSTQANYQNTCADYWGLDHTVFAAAKMGKLTYPQIIQLGNVDATVSPLCMSGVNPAAGNVTKITAAIAALTTIEIAQGIKP